MLATTFLPATVAACLAATLLWRRRRLVLKLDAHQCAAAEFGRSCSPPAGTGHGEECFVLTLQLQERPLCEEDFSREFLPLLAQLTTVGSVDRGLFVERLRALQANPMHHMVVVEDVSARRICACGTLSAEHKFIHQAGVVGHIEDVVVHSGLRGKGLGSRVVWSLVASARELGCYKCILDTEERNVAFYERLGFRRKEVQCVSYFEDNDGGSPRQDEGGGPPTPRTVEAFALQRFADLATREVALGDGLVVRPLREEDYERGFLPLLAQLTTVGELPEAFFRERLRRLRQSGTQLMFVIFDEACGRVVASASLFLELKFIHRGGRCGHIEDVVVDREQRGRGLGKAIVAAVRDAAEATGCYKCILDCSEANVAFYERCGFQRRQVCMALYLDR